MGPNFQPRLSVHSQLTLKALSFFGDGNLHRLPRGLQDALLASAPFDGIDLDRSPAPGRDVDL